jgi:hypothetical protein
MAWAIKHRPHIIGHTDAPAINWWTPAKDINKLNNAGFA